jgi:hypothetical protein
MVAGRVSVSTSTRCCHLSLLLQVTSKGTLQRGRPLDLFLWGYSLLGRIAPTGECYQRLHEPR